MPKASPPVEVLIGADIDGVADSYRGLISQIYREFAVVGLGIPTAAASA
jgi:hypothetical protein